MPREVFSFLLPSILLKAAFELYCRNESLFFLLALPLDILAMCTFIGLNVLETTLALSYGIELRPGTLRCVVRRAYTATLLISDLNIQIL